MGMNVYIVANIAIYQVSLLNLVTVEQSCCGLICMFYIMYILYTAIIILYCTLMRRNSIIAIYTIASFSCICWHIYRCKANHAERRPGYSDMQLLCFSLRNLVALVYRLNFLQYIVVRSHTSIISYM